MTTGGTLILRPEAREDIKGLADYSGQAGWMSPDSFIDLVFSTLNDLMAMPGQGSLKAYRSRRLQGIRSWSVRGFRKVLILYRPLIDGIEVIAVFRGERNIKSLLMRRLRNP